MRVRIFRPAKTAMQSGAGNARDWVIESEVQRKEIDPLMGWTGSRDTMSQVQLAFATREEAAAYAEKRGWLYTIEEPKERKVTPKAYADNFAFGRLERWTH